MNLKLFSKSKNHLRALGRTTQSQWKTELRLNGKEKGQEAPPGAQLEDARDQRSLGC